MFVTTVSLKADSTLGPFRIQSLVGKGGMGEVYSALDTRLNRSVALKVLPPEFASEPDRLRRFQLEARTLATLNHPNVALVFGFEEHASRNLLVLELVEGETLADRLHRGALPVEETIQIGIQIASALEAAHEKSIVHRDLKPANIKITPDDRVKVLDFGLAKLVTPDLSSSVTVLSDSPTIVTGSTLPGVILGTAAYMSPEQAKGKAVDKRTDIWSFGCVLYECLTGQRAFDGESVTDCIGAVLHKEPDWSALPPNAPVPFQQLVRRCLAKDRGKRLHDIADARLELEQAFEPDAARESNPRRAFRFRSTAIAAAVGTLLFVLAAVFWAGRASKSTGNIATPKQARKWVMPLPGLVPDNRPSYNISPDGSRVAFISDNRLYVRNLSELDTSDRLVRGSEGAVYPFWSPDSQWIAFGLGKKLYRVRTSDLQPNLIAECPDNFQSISGGAWLADNRLVFSVGPTNSLLELPATGGTPKIFLQRDPQTEADFHDVSPLPDGKSVVFVIHRAQSGVVTNVDTLAVSSGRSRRIIYQVPLRGEVHTPVYAPGHILFCSARTQPYEIWALPFSLKDLKSTGEPFLLYRELIGPSVARDGTALFLDWMPQTNRTIVHLDHAGKTLETLHQSATSLWHPVWSPDQRRVLTGIENHRDSEGIDLWTIGTNGARQITFGHAYAMLGAWSPNGSKVLFTRLEDRFANSAFIDELDMRATEPRKVVSGLDGRYTANGSAIVYLWAPQRLTTGPYEIRTANLSDTSKPSALLRTEGVINSLAISPDDQWLAYSSNEKGDFELNITRYPNGEGRWRVHFSEQAFWPVWRQIGERLTLFFTDQDGAIYRVTVETSRAGVLPGRPEKLFQRSTRRLREMLNWPPTFDVSPDGQEFLTVALAENAERNTMLKVVENIEADLKAKR